MLSAMGGVGLLDLDAESRFLEPSQRQLLAQFGLSRGDRSIFVRVSPERL